MPEDLMNALDIAKLLSLTTGRIYQLAKAGAIPYVRVGGRIRFPRSAWEAYTRGLSAQASASIVAPAPKVARHE